MPADEAKAFDWVIKKLGKDDPEAELRELVMAGLDSGWFEVDPAGMLRVSQEAPE